jgi:2'-5' RNA ligase
MQYGGIMVAFFLPHNVAQRLHSFKEFFSARTKVTELQDYHITLAYLPDVAVTRHALLRDVVRGFAQNEHPISGKIGGVGRFPHAEKGTNPFYTSLDAPTLPGFRHRLVKKLEAYNFAVSKMHGFTPHCTMAYIPAEEPTPAFVVPYIGVTFNGVWLASGDDRDRFPLDSTVTELKRRLKERVNALARVIG